MPETRDPLRDPADINRLLWIEFIKAFSHFLNLARKHLNLKVGAKCPRCGHDF